MSVGFPIDNIFQRKGKGIVFSVGLIRLVLLAKLHYLLCGTDLKLSVPVDHNDPSLLELRFRKSWACFQL